MEGRIIPLERDCLDLIKKIMDGSISMKEYCDGLMLLNEKYPKLGFNHVADSLYRKWIKPKPLDRKQISSGEIEE